MLKWIVDRIEGRAAAVETPIGRLPTPESLDLSGLNLPAEDVQELLRVDREGWLKELEDVETLYERFGNRLPQTLRDQLARIRKGLGAM